jgi:glycosyltransferase involved in cell wall biosynthesis
MRIVVVTHIASPYQAELFNTIAASEKIELRVVYLHRMSPTRLWTATPPQHNAFYLDEESNLIKEAMTAASSADLVVFNYYAERPARFLINERAASGKPWSFWGERPGFRKPEWVGRLFRQWMLSELHTSCAPIWGIGRFAVEGYQREFGSQRTFCNLPYFSDLERFQPGNGAQGHNDSERVFLFSGSLIRRKGVDLLARAFVRLAQELPNVRLKLLGEGKMHGSLAQTLQPVCDRVEFLGFKDWSELPEYYSAADVLCVPSRYDGWGLVVPEGLASGLPVIGTNRMGAAIEFIEDGHNGWLIPAGDETALYTALREAALMTPARLKELSQTARESISGHSLRQGAERFVRAAREACENWGC